MQAGTGDLSQANTAVCLQTLHCGVMVGAWILRLSSKVYTESAPFSPGFNKSLF